MHSLRLTQILCCAVTVIGMPVAAQELTVEVCDGMFEQDGNRSVRAHNCLGIVAKRATDPGPLLARLEGMIAADPGNPLPLMALGHALQFRDSARAETLFKQAVSEAVERGELEFEGWARFQLANCYAVTRRPAEADEQYTRAAAIGREVGRAELPTANAVIEQARAAALRSGELARGRELLLQLEAEPFFASLPNKIRLQYLQSASLVAVRLQLSAEAYALARRMATLAEADGDPHKLQDALSAAVQAWVVGEVPGVSRAETLRLARQSLELAREQGDATRLAGILWPMARLVEPDEAWDYLDELEELTRQSPWVRHMRRLVHSTNGRQLMDETPPRLEEAAEQFQLALEEALDYGSLQQVAAAFAGVAATQLRLGERDRGLAAAWRTMAVVERLEDMQEDDLLAAGLLAGSSSIYYVVADYLLDDATSPDLELAFSVSERMRSRRLDRRLDRRRSAVDEATIRDQARQEARQIGLPANPAVDAFDRSGVSALSEITARLDSSEAMLVFLMPPDRAARAWLLSLTSTNARAFPLPAVRELDSGARFWLSMIEQRAADEPVAAAALFRSLLEPAIRELPPEIRRLIVVPDGIVHRLPLDALRTVADKPLVARFDLSIAPSAGFWLRGGEARPIDSATALILADPEFEESVELPAAWRGAGAVSGRLPFAADEGAVVFRHLGGRGELRVGPEATETFLKQAVAVRPNVLHFAAHAVVDEDHPLRSAIVLAPGADGEDGLLHLDEIAGLDLEDAIVVLSGCTSAGGRYYSGEGVFGLVRAFLQAGARAVVGGLWPVRDRETADLMNGFYQGLSEGRSVEDALAATKRRLAAEGATTSAWAGFVVLGSGQASIPATTATRWPAWGLVAALVLIVCGWTVRRWRRA